MDRASGSAGPSPWAEIVGACYTVDSLGRVLGLSRITLLSAATDLRLLRLRTADDQDLFPVFQIRDRRVHPDLRRILEALKDGIDDPWTWAQWLNAVVDDQPNQMSRLWAGDLDGVLRDARHDAWAWKT